MSRTRSMALLGGAILTLSLCGCTYDYLQNSDRVGYHAGDAVKANLEGATVNPQKPSMYNKSGLGRNGYVIPQGASTDTAASGTGATTNP